MTIVQLEYIMAVDEKRSFTKAAEICHVTQPTLSMQIQKLEDELGIVIFDRYKSPLEPTKVGQIIISKARKIIREFNGIKEYLTNEKGKLSGQFRIGIIPTLAPYLVPLFLPDFVKQHPDSKLIIEELQTETIIDYLQKDRIDLGIAVTPLEEKELKEIPIFNEPIYGYVSTDHPLFKKERLSESELENAKLWLLNQGHCFRNQALKICNQNQLDTQNMEFIYESGSIETLKNMVNISSGITLIPALAAFSNINDFNMVKKFEAPEPLREVSFIVNKGYLKDNLIKELRKSIIEKIPEEYTIKYKNGRVIHWR